MQSLRFLLFTHFLVQVKVKIPIEEEKKQQHLSQVNVLQFLFPASFEEDISLTFLCFLNDHQYDLED